MLGLRLELEELDLQSITTLETIPVVSSMLSLIERLLIKSTNSILPAFSVITGTVNGSHSATF